MEPSRALIARRLLLAVLAPALLAADPGSDQGPPGEVVEVRLVELEITAEDERGAPVTDLVLDELELWVDGRPVEVETLRSGRAGASPLPGQGQGLLPPPLYLAVLVDDLHLGPASRGGVARTLRRVLTTLPPAGSVQLLLASVGRSSGLKIHHAFTDDAGQAEGGLKSLEAIPGGRSAGDLQELLGEIERSVGVIDPQAPVSPQTQVEILVARIRVYAEQERQDATRTLEAVHRLTRAMSGLPGRRVLLFVGGGMSMRPGQVLLEALRDVQRRAGSLGGQSSSATAVPIAFGVDDTSILTAVARSAALLGVRIDTVDGESLGAGSELDPGRGAVRSTVGITPAHGEVWSPARGSRDRSDLETPLRLLAAESGGRWWRRASGLEVALARLLRGEEARYSLDFALRDSTPHEIHTVEVQAGRSGVTVHHAPRFRDERPDDGIVARTLAAFYLGVAENPLRFEVQAGTPRPSEQVAVVPVVLRMPIDELAVAAGPQAHHGQLSVFVASGDPSREPTGVEKTILPVEIPNDEILATMGRRIEVKLEVELSRSGGRVALGIRDDGDRRMATQLLDLGGDVSPHQGEGH